MLHDIIIALCSILYFIMQADSICYIVRRIISLCYFYTSIFNTICTLQDIEMH